MTAMSEGRIGAHLPGLMTIVLSVLLVVLAIFGFAGTKGVVNGLISTGTLWGPWAWQTTLVFLKNLLMLVVGIAGVFWLRPWKLFKRSTEPVSPGTRRTNRLFWLSGLLGIPGALLISPAFNSDGAAHGALSSVPISPWLAIVAMASWLLANVVAWWWYVSADEHERRANDVGFLLGGGVFITAAPMWWVASRAGLMPPPDAMILWFVTVLLMAIGWFWYRSR